MKKENMLDFINRYHLGGRIDAAAWVFENGTVTTKFRSDDKTFMGIIQKKHFGFDEDCELGILETSKLVKMVNILGDDFDFALNKFEADDEEKITSIKLVNGTTRVNYMLADLTVIPKSKGIKNEPEYDLTVKVTDEFIDSFIKGIGALPESHLFTIVFNPKLNAYEIVIGYSSINAHSIYLPINVEVHTDTDRPISFASSYFKEILLANRGADSFTFSVSTQGISHIEVQEEDYVIDYYLGETPTDI